jgi:beta-ribofuranosylaminobenzene 5'-phosphate synthase
MIRVRTPSRLHFGFLNPAEGGTWSNHLGEPRIAARQFGGAGLMVQAPGVELTAQPARDWSAEGPLAARALEFARRFAASLPPLSIRPQHLRVERSPAEHSGLGSGTQLGLAVAQALALAHDLDELAPEELARRIGRGARSAVGVHGFARGGFLVEGGKSAVERLGPLVAHFPFPEDWPVLIIVPPWAKGLHGAAELEALKDLGNEGKAAALCRLVLQAMLPAIVEHDLTAFGEAVYDFNARVGELFADVQGGRYAHPRTGDLVAFLRAQGIRGVGQSSWGPAVFAITADPERAAGVAEEVRRAFHLGPEQLRLTAACNRGAVAER